jgi:CRISPR-associated endonuclease Csn1
MTKILGLDLGTNSIGWAVIDDSKEEIVDAGARIFTEGVDNLGQGEKEISKNATRRQARQARRQIFRRKLRKNRLLKLLKQHGMCPHDLEDYESWIRLNPYTLRSQALTGRIELMALGRVFYHMSQRRGFLSNSKRQMSNSDGVIFKGKDGKTGIDETIDLMGRDTLGAYLRSIYPDDGQPYKSGLPRIRNRFTTRQMYIDEFEAIWESQKDYHATLTQEVKELIGGRKREIEFLIDGVLFFQRPLRSQKHLLGKCRFEPGKTKCPISALPFEYFRTHQFINNIRCNEEPLNEEERRKVLNVLLKTDKPKFSKIRKILGKTDQYYNFNYADNDAIAGSYTIRNLSHKKAFDDEWFSFSNEKQEAIWHILYTFDDIKKLKAYALTNWQLPEDKAEFISKLQLKDGYASVSRKAINNILPFLKMGFGYAEAVTLGGVKNAFGPNWTIMTDNEIDSICEAVLRIAKEGEQGGYMDALKDLVTSEFNIDASRLPKLYHHSADTEEIPLQNSLPYGREADLEIINIKNPVVTKALFELRKVVNALIHAYGSFDRINVELARDLKNSKSTRQRIRRDNQQREAWADRIVVELRAHNINVSRENIDKYKLWEECNKTCPFSGDQIGITDLFENGRFQIEHILPYSRTLDDSFINKTLCRVDINVAKSRDTPYEYFSKSGSWDKAVGRAKSIFFNNARFPNRYLKFQRFTRKTLIEDEFIQRQLNDTRYISKVTKSYLQKVCKDVRVAPGQLTARLRRLWSLNTILDSPSGIKNRLDHRHHAIDALVMACFKLRFLQEISHNHAFGSMQRDKHFPMPFSDFRYQAEETIRKIIVSHTKSQKAVTKSLVKYVRDNKVYKNTSIVARGPLHKESVYGKRNSGHGDAFHIRKSLSDIKNDTHLKKIVDTRIRNLLLDRLRELGVDIAAKKFTIPQGAFFDKSEDGELLPLIWLNNRRGDRVPVWKVRIKANLGHTAPLKDGINQYVNLRSNHHVLLYKDTEGEIKENVVTFWEVVERIRQGQAAVQLPSDGEEVVAVLCKKDVYRLNIDPQKSERLLNEDVQLYILESVSSKYYEFRLLSESTQTRNTRPIYFRIQSFGHGITGWLRLDPKKVNVDILGHIKDSI